MSDYRIPDNRTLPPGWKVNIPEINHGIYFNPKRNLTVLVTPAKGVVQGELDWVHVSYSHPNKTPSHETTAYVKRYFVGEDREAIAIFPPKDRYVNTHPHCLHLWFPVNESDITWPRFESRMGSLGLQI